MRILQILFVLAACVWSFSANAYWHQHCSTSTGYQKPRHANDTVTIRIVNRDWNAAQEAEIIKGLKEWDQNKLGYTYFDLNWSFAEPVTEAFHNLVRNNSSTTANHKDELLAAYHWDNDDAHIYLRGRAPIFFSANGGIITESASQISSTTYAWVHNRTKRPTGSQEWQCSNHPNNFGNEQIHWVPGRDIQIRAEHELGGGANRVTNVGYWDTVSGNFKKDLNYITVHEAGHIVGLGHPDQNPSTFNGWPTVMASGYVGAASTLHTGGDLMTSSLTKRHTMPYGDDLRGVRSNYQSNSPYRLDTAINQFQVPAVTWLGMFWDNVSQSWVPHQGFLNRQSWLWAGYNNTNSFPPHQYWPPRGTILPWQQSNPWVGFLPFTVHNLSASTRSMGGLIYMRKSNGSTSGTWKGPEFTFWVSNVPARGFKVIAPIPYTVNHPNPGPTNFESGKYRYVLDMIWTPSGDQQGFNDRDVVAQEYNVRGFGN